MGDRELYDFCLFSTWVFIIFNCKLARALRNEGMHVHAWRKERRNLSAGGSFSRKLGFSNSNLPEYSRPQTRDMSGLTLRKLKWKSSLSPQTCITGISLFTVPHTYPQDFLSSQWKCFILFSCFLALSEWCSGEAVKWLGDRHWWDLPLCLWLIPHLLKGEW